MANPDKTSSGRRKCVGCKTELPGGATGELCPKCLLKIAMETQPGPGPGGTAAAGEAGRRSRGLPQPGEQLGHYTIARPLGVGGMGAVFEAQDLESGRRVALKVLSHTLDSPEARERFFREGRLAASINHPNSVYIFGTEEIGGTPVIAMELVSGGTLQDRVRERGPLPVAEAVDAVLQMIEGLEAAQRLGILHRDIKPSNCYMDEDGTVKIGDFGLSISTAVRTEPALTATGAFLGTPAFCSPEQLRGEDLNARSDMYSVGATLYYLLTGRTPFETKNMVQLLATVLEQPAPSPRQFRPEIPKGLAKAVLRCLEKQPGERFKSYGDLAHALRPYSATAPTPATLGLRFVAGVLDTALLALLATVVNLSAFGGSPMDFMEESMKLSPKALACVVGWFIAATLYYAVFEGLWGAAAGKALCGLRVVGADRNPPGFLRGWVRGVTFILPPVAPYWLAFGANPKAYMSVGQWTQMFVGLSVYWIMALLFVTARRRNGFAAVQDLLSRSRVISRAAVSMRPVLPVTEAPPPDVEASMAIGPYHVLQPLAEAAGEKWFLAFDLKLLRKVWLRMVPPGTEPVPAALRALGRVGRLRWLTGKRSAEESWDAFEALSGQPLLELARRPQPWREVRYWLHDLATEIAAAEKDGTLPELGLERVWITAEGRAKLLDFPAPGFPLTPPLSPAPGAPTSSRLYVAARPGSTLRPADALSRLEVGAPGGERGTLPPLLRNTGAFLNQVAAAALSGGVAVAAGEAKAPLPLHARTFLEGLGEMSGAEAVAAALKPLLTRAAVVSRLRRAALVAGCIAFPVVGTIGGIWAFGFMQQLMQRTPGVMDLHMLLQARSAGHFFGATRIKLPDDRLFGIYIAQHYRGLITNETSWSNPFVLALIKGEGREFAERSLVKYVEPTQAEIDEAEAAVSKHLPKDQPFGGKPPPGLPMVVLGGCLFIYVGVPAVLAALMFRGGVVLLVAGVTYVRRDGARASRLRLLWRSLVTWTPAFGILAAAVVGMATKQVWQPWLAVALVAMLAAVSVLLPRRGLQDWLAGTWPVPR